MLYLNGAIGATVTYSTTFNFNKCCIWMVTLEDGKGGKYEFNFNKCCIWITEYFPLILEGSNLTLTSVVFE